MGSLSKNEQDNERDNGKPGPEPALDAWPLPDDPFTPLEHLVHLLQGSVEPTIADAGITVLPSAHLDRIANNARREADLCTEHAEVFMDLLECCLENGRAPEPGTLLSMTRQLRRLARDQRRWHDLADNAAYYRDNAQVATRIAAWISRRLPRRDKTQTASDESGGEATGASAAE